VSVFENKFCPGNSVAVPPTSFPGTFPWLGGGAGKVPGNEVGSPPGRTPM